MALPCLKKNDIENTKFFAAIKSDKRAEKTAFLIKCIKTNQIEMTRITIYSIVYLHTIHQTKFLARILIHCLWAVGITVSNALVGRKHAFIVVGGTTTAEKSVSALVARITARFARYFFFR